MRISLFYGQGAFDTNDLFDLMHQISAKPIIKISGNASTYRYRGSKYRKKAVKEYQKKRYRQWAEENNYGMRWLGTEGIFSAVKGKFGENCVNQPLISWNPRDTRGSGYMTI